MDFGDIEVRWFEFGATALYMVLQYDLDVVICLTNRDDLHSNRFNNNGSCRKDTATVDKSNGQVYIPGIGAYLTLLTINSPTRSFSLVEFESFEAQEFEAPFKSHETLRFKYQYYSINLITYTLIF